MNSVYGHWIPSDAPGPGPGWEGSAEAAAPLAAALLLGLAVPGHLRDRVGRVVLHEPPIEESDGDGMPAYAWNRDGVRVALAAMPDGRSRASCRIAPVTHTVQGETVRGQAAELTQPAASG